MTITRATNIITALFVATMLLAMLAIVAFGRDDGRFANSPLKPWFEHLKSSKGLCCSFADGISISDVDWDTKDGHYRVRVPATKDFPGSKDEYLDVPDAAVVNEPNRFGPAVVWPYFDGAGQIQIRCFIPGAGT